MCFVLKKELLQIPLFGWALRLLEPIAIDRTQRSSALDQVITQGKERLQQGRYVVIFPEGKRMPPGQLGTFKAGAAALAKAADCVIIPVTHNAGQFWQRRALLKKPGCIDVVIGQPITTQGKTVNQIRDEMREVIQRMLTTR
jgi:1-acyl-sn-glycerol-3-phosphate acyltransferase